ncbi:coiled-coil protein [[Eubacterium] cellulosolvens]
MALEGVTKLVETASEFKHKAIDDIVKKIEDLKEKHIHFRNECKTWIGKRNLLNSELKKLSEKIREIKRQRDAVNDEVKNLKNSRDKLREEISEKQKKANSLITDLKQIRPEARGNLNKTKKTLEELEWKFQTSSLDMKEENKMLVQVKELEEQLSRLQQVRGIQDAVTEEKTEITSIRKNAQSIHEKLLEGAEASQRLHEEMMQSVAKLKETKSKADEAHQKYLQAKTQAEKAEQELIANTLEMKNLRKEFYGDEEAERLKKANEFTAKLLESGSTKLGKGKKISLEEFKALMEHKKI